MKQDTPKNMAASVSARLLTISKARGEDFRLTLEQYAVERFLERMTKSVYAQRFVLKGAMLYPAWVGASYRPTRDMDLHARDPISKEALAAAVREISETPTSDDGLRFDVDGMKVADIREDQAHGGKRVTMKAFIGSSRINVQIDVGFGDVITPGPTKITYPALLTERGIENVMAYPIETVIAEKLEAMVSIGNANSRIKDFYDIWTFARVLSFDGERVSTAIKNTFDRRETSIPAVLPEVMTPEFASSQATIEHWAGFLRRTGIVEATATFVDVVALIATFAMPLFAAAHEGSEFRQRWSPGGPWSVA